MSFFGSILPSTPATVDSSDMVEVDGGPVDKLGHR